MAVNYSFRSRVDCRARSRQNRGLKCPQATFDDRQSAVEASLDVVYPRASSSWSESIALLRLSCQSPTRITHNHGESNGDAFVYERTPSRTMRESPRTRYPSGARRAARRGSPRRTRTGRPKHVNALICQHLSSRVSMIMDCLLTSSSDSHPHEQPRLWVLPPPRALRPSVHPLLHPLVVPRPPSDARPLRIEPTRLQMHDQQARDQQELEGAAVPC